jgi:phosphoribosylpyrophosphate synthetase
LFVPNAHGIRSQHVAFLASFSSPGVIFEQLSIIYALPRMFVSSFTLVLPFFPTGTLERMEDEGDIATAFTLARILSNIPISRGGPTSLVIFDIHALQVCLSANMSQHLQLFFCIISMMVPFSFLLVLCLSLLVKCLRLMSLIVSGKVLFW